MRSTIGMQYPDSVAAEANLACLSGLARRWLRECRTLLVREEVVTLERIQDLAHRELLIRRLPELAGSPSAANPGTSGH